MEISKLTDNSIKIKTKNITVAIDPTTKTDAEMVIVTDENNDAIQIPEDAKLVIEGPGEYEVGGISAKGEKVGNEYVYTLFDDQYRIILAPMGLVSKIESDDDTDAIIIKATGPITKKDVSTLSTDVLIVYGRDGNMTEDENVKKMSKVNLKKKEEVKGFIVYLA